MPVTPFPPSFPPSLPPIPSLPFHPSFKWIISYQLACQPWKQVKVVSLLHISLTREKKGKLRKKGNIATLLRYLTLGKGERELIITGFSFIVFVVLSCLSKPLPLSCLLLCKKQKFTFFIYVFFIYFIYFFVVVDTGLKLVLLHFSDGSFTFVTPFFFSVTTWGRRTGLMVCSSMAWIERKKVKR